MIGIKEKIAYGFGDTASNLVFQTVMLFLTFYYTDIVGLSPASVGTMFLVVRIIDAVTDPLMGAMADRTRSRWGSYRPYLLWLAIPFAISSVMAFTSPPFEGDGKFIYAFVTYTFLMLMYTAINIPYSALGGVMSSDPEDRVSIQSYRFVFAMLGGLLVTSLTLPLVDYLGRGDKALGYQYTMIVMSILGMVLFGLCFAGTRERIRPVSALKVKASEQMAALWRNDQWRVLCLVGLVLLTGMVLRNTLAIYYVKYVMQRPDDVTLFVTVGLVGSIIGCALAQPLVKRVCKIKAYIGLQITSAVICFINYFIPTDAWFVSLVLHFSWGLTLQMATPLLWSKMADTVDYGEWKSGVRLTGVTYSTIVFFIKVGLALGGAMAGWLLAFYGYEADIHKQVVVDGIVLSFCLLPAMASLMVALIMRWYKLDNQNIARIQQELGDKRLATQ